MKLPVFASCCCGCTLKMGSLIVGYLGAIGSTTIILATIIALSYPSGLDSFEVAALVIGLIYYVIYLAFYGVLIIGAHKLNVKFLRILVIWATVLLCFGVASTVLTLISGDIATGLVYIVGLILQAYFVLVVRSFYLELESSPRQNDFFQGQATQNGQSGYPAQSAFQPQPNYPAQPTYPAQSDNQADAHGYPTQSGPQFNAGFANTGTENNAILRILKH